METLNAKIRNIVNPIVTLLDVLDGIKGDNLTTEQKLKALDLMPTLLADARRSVERLIN